LKLEIFFFFFCFFFFFFLILIVILLLLLLLLLVFLLPLVGCIDPCSIRFSPQGVTFCQFFNSPAGCRRGGTCGFVHSLDAVPSKQLKNALPGNPAFVRHQPVDDVRDAEHLEKQLKHLSDYYNVEIIVAEPTQQTANSARFQTLCHFFNKAEGCKAGDQCGFVHKEIIPHVTICHFYRSEKGCCVKNCGFLHQYRAVR
jgi:hypothetical protein